MTFPGVLFSNGGDYSNFIKHINIYVNVVSLNLMAYIAGITFSWASPAIPHLDGSKDPDINPLPERITLTEKSWLTAFIFIGGLVGNFITMYIVKKLGRKKSLLIMTIPTIIAYILLSVSGNLIAFFIARICCGMTLAGTLQIVPVYVGELASKETRGALGCYFSIFLATGQLYVYAVGPWITFEVFNYINLVFPCLAFVLIAVFVNESPYHFVDRGEMEKAKVVLSRLRPYHGDGENIDTELEEMQQAIEAKKTQIGLKQLFGSGALRKSLIIAIGLQCTIQVTIINPVASYLEKIFTDTDTGISPEMSSVYVSGLQLVTLLFLPQVVDRLGRKIFIVGGQILVTISLSSLGIYFYLKSNDYEVDTLTWLPLASILLFIVSFAMGVGSVTFVIIGEILPDNAKNISTTISFVINNIIAFTILFVFPLMEYQIGSAITYWIFSALCAGTVVFFVIQLPETKGKSFLEIQAILSK